MTRTMHLALIVCAVSTASSVASVRLDAQDPTVAQKVAAIKAGVAANQAAIRKYTWLQTTTVALKGEVKSTKVSQCSYQAAPKPVCTEISSTSAAPPKGGPLVKHEVEKKTAEMKAYMDSVGVLVAMYIPRTPRYWTRRPTLGTSRWPRIPRLERPRSWSAIMSNRAMP